MVQLVPLVDVQSMLGISFLDSMQFVFLSTLILDHYNSNVSLHLFLLFSDKPGNHNFDLLRKLVLPDGSVLRAQLPGRPTRDCLFVDPARDGNRLALLSHLSYKTITKQFCLSAELM